MFYRVNNRISIGKAQGKPATDKLTEIDLRNVLIHPALQEALKNVVGLKLVDCSW